MLLRRSMFALVVLAGCPQHTPPAPPTDPPPTVGGGGSQRPEEAVTGDPASGGASDRASDSGPGSGPALAAPGGGESLADTLAPRQREQVRGGPEHCRSGHHEEWKDDCNTCRCGSDGEVACTDLACGKPRG